MNKETLRQQIIDKLQTDHALLLQAAKTAHAAATHEENIPDNKYATLALEASYIAQGQADRANEISAALTQFKQLELKEFNAESTIRLSAVVTLEDDAGQTRTLFIAPAAGGQMLSCQGTEIRVITPDSPLGKKLLGCCCGDAVTMPGNPPREFEIVAVC